MDTGADSLGSDVGSLVEVAFEVDDPTYPFVGASERESCQLELVEMVRRGDGAYSEYFRVSDADPERIQSLASEVDQVEPHFLRETADGGLFEFVVQDGCVATSLADMGGIPRVVRGEDGDGVLKAELPRERAEEIVETFMEKHEGVELVAHEDGADSPPVFSDPALQETLEESLTMPQREAMVGAFSHGYYEWPQRSTLGEVARTLGLSPGTFADRLHAAEQKFLSVLFERDGVDPDDERQQPLTDADVSSSRSE